MTGIQFTADEAHKGAYVLLIDVCSRLNVTLRGQTFELFPGLYAYCGSAKGPGGLKARIGRHCRRDKPVHWHVDQVTTQADVIDVAVSMTLTECDLAGRLAKHPGVDVPVGGFGASDCRQCESHFLKLPGRDAFDTLGLEAFEI